MTKEEQIISPSHNGIRKEIDDTIDATCKLYWNTFTLSLIQDIEGKEQAMPINREEIIEAIKDMSGTLEKRRIGRFEPESKHLVISTVFVTDGKQPYETAVSHTSYNPGWWIPVEAYDTLDEAEIGHAKWIAMMIAIDLPEELINCKNSIESESQASSVKRKTNKEIEKIRLDGFFTLLGDPPSREEILMRRGKH